MADHSENLISAYLDDQLGADERAQFEQRLQQDSELRQLTEKLKSQSEELRALPKFSLDANFAQRLLEDANSVRLFGESDAALQPVAVAQNIPISKPQRNWQYTLGVIVSIAALVLIAAFLVIPRVSLLNVAERVAEDSATAAADSDAPKEEEITLDSRSTRGGPMDLAEDKAAGATANKGSESEVLFAGADAKRYEQAQMDQTKTPESGFKGQAPNASMMKVAPKLGSRSDLQPTARKQTADIRSADEIQTRDRSRPSKSMRSPASEPLKSTFLSDGLSKESDDVEGESATQVDPVKGDVIEVNFANGDRNLDYFMNSLERNRIVFDQRSKSVDKQSGAGLGRIGGVKALKQPAAEPSAQRVFLIEATDQQMAAVVADLQQRAKLSQLSAKSVVNQIADSQAPPNRAAGTNGKSDDQSLNFADQAKFANAREINISSSGELKTANEILNRFKKSETAKSKKAVVDEKLEMLRRFVVLLNMEGELNSPIESSESIPANPADK